MNENIVYYGSEIKLKIGVEPVHGLTMDDYNFDCEFYCYSNRKVKVEKVEMVREDENNYIAVLRTQELGTGTLKCKITSYIPDTYGGNDWERTEICTLDTGVYIMGV